MKEEKKTEYIMVDRLEVKNNLNEDMKQWISYFLRHYVDIIWEKETINLMNEILENISWEEIMRYFKN